MQEKPRDWHNFLRYLLIEQHWHGSQHTNGRPDISSALFASIHLSCTISFTTALHLLPAARLLWVESRAQTSHSHLLNTAPASLFSHKGNG